MAYCEKYGFDDKRRADFLRLLDLSRGDHALVRRLLDQVISPNLDAIVDDFYSYMLQQPEFVNLIARYKIDIAALKITQRSYLLSIGQGFDGEEYFERRLRIGIVHAWNHVPLCQYLGAYRILQQLILRHIPETGQRPEQRNEMCAFVLKILTLDMLLAVETYHEVQLNALEDKVSILRHEEARLKLEVAVDQLTRLASRTHAMDVLARQLEESRTRDRQLSLIMADLDHFKTINDKYGHQIGDQILAGIAARIKSCVRDIDTVGRYGGEEIIIVLPHADMDTARLITERIRQKISGSPYGIGEYLIEMTISAGIATLAAGDTAETLIQRADAALYTAKRTGRDRIVIDV